MAYKITRKGRYGYLTPTPPLNTLSKIVQALSYTKKNSKFMPNPLWGHVCLYDRAKHRFPVGLTNKVRDILGTCGLDFTGLRPYQETAVVNMCINDTGIIKMPTGSGKTHTAIAFIKHANLKTLVLVPTLDLVLQWGKQVPEGVHVKTYKAIKRKAYVQQFGLVIFDECIHGKTNIRLHDNTEKTIKEIYNDDKINYVLSYNEKKKIFEKKKIIRKIKTPMKESWYEIIIKDSINNIHKIKATNNHKIWTENGYKRVDELIKNDVLKVYLEPKSYICKICNKEFNNKNSLGRCMALHKNPNMLLKAAITTQKKLKERNMYPQLIKNMIKKRRNNPHYLKNMADVRKGKNNPVFKHKDTIDKIKQTCKNNFKKLSKKIQEEQIKRFVNAPRYRHNKITRPEQYIIDMNINGLNYVGLGNKILYFNNGKRKIPDFIMEKEKKIIEVGDFKYWHTKEEAVNIIKKYKEIGYECIYLDSKEVQNGLCDDLIKKFCYNHSASILKINKLRKAGRGYKYNLEIDDNHNYIANNILISNCHHVAAKTLYKIGMNIHEDALVYGFSATPLDRDDDNLKVEAVLGPIIYEVPIRTMIDEGFLCDAEVHYHSLAHQEFKYVDYHEVYSEYIVFNMERNEKILSLAMTSAKPCLILVNRIEHGENLIKYILEVYGSSCRFLNGQMKKDERADNKHDIIIATGIYDEGIDLPALRTLIIGTGGRSSIKTCQRIGRVLRPLEGKEKAIVHDFKDNCLWLDQHYIKRRKIFERDFEVIDDNL